MPLQAFCFPFPETRFFKAGSFIYKFKIRGGNSYSGEEVKEEERFNQELEEIIRTVLGNLDGLQPFSTAHYTVFPYKKRWERVYKHSDNLTVYPFVLILYLEKNMQDGNQAEEQKEAAQHESYTCGPQPKRCRRDSPLEEAIIKDLLADMEAESRVSVTRKLDIWPAHGEVKEHPGRVDETETRDVNKQGSGVSRRSVSPGGTTQDTEDEEYEEEETPGTPERPGILSRLASHVFSLFFKDP
ncbi:uncharacterized protein majin [Stegastes partitus]|uniref:Uncharacterized protein majin n=1 Tax=Stegastes partitus TaxID=144197 RepID=A0A9Y4K4E7_9TELE|nr:PREDICTED: uncharacterized protein C11orf85 homolog [Stegastes partitus]